MKTDFLSDIQEKIAEKGIIYFYGESKNNKDTAFLMWVGYFDCIFEAIFDQFEYEKMPIEFKMYNLAEDYDNTIAEAVLIDIEYTLSMLYQITDKEFTLSGAKECLNNLIEFMEKNKNERFFITEG